MIWLAVKTAAAVAALWGVAFWMLDRRERRMDGTSMAWINALADRSRRKKPARRICRYSKAG